MLSSTFGREYVCRLSPLLRMSVDSLWACIGLIHKIILIWEGKGLDSQGNFWQTGRVLRNEFFDNLMSQKETLYGPDYTDD